MAKTKNQKKQKEIIRHEKDVDLLFLQQEQLNKKQPKDELEARELEKQSITLLQKTRSFIQMFKSKKMKGLERRLETLEKKALETIKSHSQYILNTMNEKYHTNFKADEILENYTGYYLEQGVQAVFEKYDILNRFAAKLLEDIMPKHPMLEYPEARSLQRTFIIHTGPTNSGKTYESLEALKQSEKGVYLAPLRLLALEVYNKLNYEGVPCDLKTGEEDVEIPFAKHVSSTIERADYEEEYEVAVIDEAQLICDNQRGHSWTRAILGLKAKEIHISCSPNAIKIITNLIEDCKDTYIIKEHVRSTPLIVEKGSFQFPEDIQKGDALIVFSRKKVIQVASYLAEQNINASLIYGNLPPDTRRKQVELFEEGKTDVVISTDAIGMGLNLPIRRIIFLEAEKYDGTDTRKLTTQEFKQIAGRAGRKGMYEKGYVNAVNCKRELETALKEEDELIREAQISPLEKTILTLPFGDLKDRLLAWQNYRISVPHLSKIDISIQLQLIQELELIKDGLSVEDMYKAVNIPFNHKNEILLNYWKRCILMLQQNKTELDKPIITQEEKLFELETGYRLIDLYYSFSKAFSLKIDKEWVKQERDILSERIHLTLRQNVQKYAKKCIKCGEVLLWNRITTCKKCLKVDKTKELITK